MSAAASLARVRALAWNGHRQAVRDKALVVIAAFSVAMVLGSLIVSELTVGERGRVVTDFGLSSIDVLTLLLAVFVSINQVAKDIERRTIDTILSKPVDRWELVVGRACGIALTTGVVVLVLGILLSGLLLAVKAHDPQVWKCLLLSWIGAILAGSIALFVSSFATPLPAQFIALAILVIGHTSRGLVMLAERAELPLAKWILRVLYLVTPNFDLLNFRAQVVWHAEIPWLVVARGVAYGLGVSGVLLVLAAAVLSRRDLA